MHSLLKLGWPYLDKLEELLYGCIAEPSIRALREACHKTRERIVHQRNP